jgi:leader peptidase (prepilin peptidase) / N-methyltransferase
VTLPWIIGAAVLGVLAGTPIRRCVNSYVRASRDTGSGAPESEDAVSAGSALGQRPLVAELTAGLAMALVAARATSAWELAALAWLVLLAVPLAFIDSAVHRLPNPLTAAAFAGVLALLAVGALTAGHPGALARTAIGAAALTCFYLLLWVIRPGGMGLGDVKLSASVGLALGWISWQALFAGTLFAFVLAAVTGIALVATGKAGRGSQLPLGPFMLLGALAAAALLS